MSCQKATILAILALASLSNAPPREPPFTILPPAASSESGARGVVTLTLDLQAESRVCEMVEVFQLAPSDRARRRWRLESDTIRKVVDATLTLQGRPGKATLLALRCPGITAYALHGPFEWPLGPERQAVDLRARRTIRGTLPGQVSPPRVTWLDSEDSGDADPWPTCSLVEPARWQCIGLPLDRSGVVLAPDSQPLSYGIVPLSAIGQPVEMRSAAWGRLIRILGVSHDKTELHVAAKKPSSSGRRPRSIRMFLTPDDTITVSQVSRSSFWISGSRRTEEGVLEITGARIATERIPMDDWQGGPPELPIYVPTAPPILVAGQVLTADGRPARRSLVSVSELYADPAPRREAVEEPPYRRSITEVRTDSQGRFQIAGLGPHSYEFLATHATLGRVSAILEPDTAPIVLRLKAPKQVRGRVVRELQPVSGVPVRTVPNLAQLAESIDPTDYIGGDTITDRDGRFLLALPPRGSGELRIGQGGTGVVRLPLPVVTQMPLVTDLGDIELFPLARLIVRIDGVDACELYAIGPLGSPGVEIMRPTRQAPGVRSFRLPESGWWWLSLVCNNLEEPLRPSFVHIPPDSAETSIRALVMPQPDR